MKNIVYLIVSTGVILGIITVVIGLYRNNMEVTKSVSHYTNAMQDFDSKMMLKQGKITGGDIISEVEFFRDEARVFEIKFSASKTIKIENDENRDSKIGEALKYIMEKTYTDSATGEEKTFLLAEFKRTPDSSDMPSEVVFEK